MIQEDRELLLRDLCARLPYGVIVLTPNGSGHVCEINFTIFGYELGVNINPIIRDTFSINDVKPYLFPLSSMTEEQEEEYNDLNSYELCCFPHTEEALDYLIKNHFDYRGLIPKGLAIDATGLNIY